ncbi:phosphate-induced protein 1 [Radiomyces spectabilis]|uniref:phosphate-induced protein 1 n=1 Tax=Radiomyces spectabilis TaxID=64574 RepID=UPI00221EF37D|nr:phosphate-induced protein 1 [Radiomyces spectabilis]KAI8393491.1 phosphate-induced protein 1 [Radiomyces spectabilis]
MLFSALGTIIVSALGLVAAQQPTNADSNSHLTPTATKYADTFKNAGGRVLHDKVNVYLIFYGEWNSTEAKTDQSIIMNFLDRVSTAPWFSTLKKYPDSNGNTVTGPLNLAAALTDSGSHGLQLNDANTHQQIVTDAVNSGYLSATNQLDGDGVYIILAGQNVQDKDFCNAHCGYNSYNDQFQYIFVGHPKLCQDRCIPPFNKETSPNNSPAADAFITILSHELQDILTDPKGDGWVIQENQKRIELGDFCAGANVTQEQWFGQLSQIEAGKNASYNIAIDGNKYLVQTIFDREKKSCVLSGN